MLKTVIDCGEDAIRHDFEDLSRQKCEREVINSRQREQQGDQQLRGVSWDMGLAGQIGKIVPQWWNSVVKAGGQKSKFGGYVVQFG